MRLQKSLVIGTVMAMLVSGAVIAIVTSGGKAGGRITHARYYCPMHPAYTSDRPGNCPICNMKLVRADDTAPQAQAQFSSICYLHNCPKLHEGRPCPMTVVAKPGERVTCPICGTHVAEAASAQADRKILYWTDPMIPGYKADGPGKSPMGMDLVPVYDEERRGRESPTSSPEGYAPVLLTPQKQQLIGVKTAAVGRRKLTKTIRVAGTIAHDPELYQAQAEYIQANRALEQAKATALPDAVTQAERLADSSRIRLKHLGLSDELIQEIAAWQEPEHGLLFARPGEPVWTYAQVYEYELPLVHVGQDVAVEVPALTGQLFHGTVRAIDQMVEPMTRTTRIRAQLDNPQGQLKPDMYVNVSIGVDLGEVLAVPEDAVFATGEHQIVFVDKGQGLFDPRDVTLGAKADGYYEIKSGLVEGEAAVTSGNFLIDSESRLKGALEGLGGVEHQHGQ